MWCLNGIANRDGRVNNLKINRFIDFIKIYYKLIKSAFKLHYEGTITRKEIKSQIWFSKIQFTIFI